MDTNNNIDLIPKEIFENHILIHFNFIQLLNKIRIISKKLNKYFINFISTTHHHHHHNNNNNNNNNNI